MGRAENPLGGISRKTAGDKMTPGRQRRTAMIPTANQTNDLRDIITATVRSERIFADRW